MLSSLFFFVLFETYFTEQNFFYTSFFTIRTGQQYKFWSMYNKVDCFCVFWKDSYSWIYDHLTIRNEILTAVNST